MSGHATRAKYGQQLLPCAHAPGVTDPLEHAQLRHVDMIHQLLYRVVMEQGEGACPGLKLRLGWGAGGRCTLPRGRWKHGRWRFRRRRVWGGGSRARCKQPRRTAGPFFPHGLVLAVLEAPVDQRATVVALLPVRGLRSRGDLGSRGDLDIAETDAPFWRATRPRYA